MVAAWHTLKSFWHLAAVCAASALTNFWLLFQKGAGDVITWLPLVPALVMALLELLRWRDTRQQKGRDREQELDDRAQRLYEREIAGLEKELQRVNTEVTRLNGQLKEVTEDRDRLRVILRRTPHPRRPR